MFFFGIMGIMGILLWDDDGGIADAPCSILDIESDGRFAVDWAKGHPINKAGPQHGYLVGLGRISSEELNVVKRFMDENVCEDYVSVVQIPDGRLDIIYFNKKTNRTRNLNDDLKLALLR